MAAADLGSPELNKANRRIRELEAALHIAVSALELCETPMVEEPEMGAALRLIGMKVGFGAAMQSLYTSWVRVDQMKGRPEDMALTVGPCDRILKPALRQGRAALKGTQYEHNIIPAARVAERAARPDDPADAGHVDLETSG